MRRAGAIGDVLLTTPIVHRLRKLYPEAEIDVETHCPQVFEGNPHIGAVRNNMPAWMYDKIIDLNMAYESHPDMHIGDAYSIAAFGDPEIGRGRVVFGIDPPPPRAMAVDSKIAVIHGTRSWPSRAMPDAWYENLITGLLSQGFKISVIGGGGDFRPQPREGVFSLVSQTSLREAANEIASAAVAILSDSSMLHFAGCTETPIVGLFTSVKAQYRLPFRNGAYGWNCTAITPRQLDGTPLECYGCHALTPGRTWLACSRNDNICATSLRVDDAVIAAQMMMGM